MSWLPIATTIENEVVYACDDMEELQWLTEPYFNVIPKIFSLKKEEINWIKEGDLNFRVRYNGHRDVYLEHINERNPETAKLSKLITYKHRLFNLFRGRLEHGWHRAKSLMPELDLVYEYKYKEALHILANNGLVEADGFVSDYALENNMPVIDAAMLIKIKHENAMSHVRKLERMRLRHMNAIKKAQTLEELEKVHAAIDKDLFTNMLL